MKKLTAFLLLATLAVISFAQVAKDSKMPVTTKSDKALALYMEAMTSFEDVNFNAANTHLIDALKADPDFFMANYQMAMSNIGNKEKMTPYANAALNCKAKLSRAEELIKSSLSRLVADPKADVRDIGLKLVEMYPRDIMAYYFLNSFQGMAQDIAGCEKTLLKGLDITNNPAPVYNMLGYTYLNLKMPDKACKAFDKYIELAPKNPNAYDSKGDYFMSTKEYRKAYDSYMKAHSIDTAWSYKNAQKAKHLADSLGI